jgi:hypothetical protein
VLLNSSEVLEVRVISSCHLRQDAQTDVETLPRFGHFLGVCVDPSEVADRQCRPFVVVRPIEFAVYFESLVEVLHGEVLIP